MKNRGSWCGALVAAFAIGAGWTGYMGWPPSGLITLAAEQANPPKEQSNPPKEQSNPPKEQSSSPKEKSNSPNPPPAPAAVQDPNCPGKDNHALMCRPPAAGTSHVRTLTVRLSPIARQPCRAVKAEGLPAGLTSPIRTVAATRTPGSPPPPRSTRPHAPGRAPAQPPPARSRTEPTR